MAVEPIPTEHALLDHITSVIMDDPELQVTIDKYVRAVQGREADEDVSDSEEYWNMYSARLMHLVIRAAGTWWHPELQEEVVF